MDTKPKLSPQATEWWSSLNKQWQAIFKEAIGINSEPTVDELMTILNLTQLNCNSKGLTSLEPLRALTGLQTLNCGGNQLTSLEPLQGYTYLKFLDCRDNHLTSLEPLRALTGLRTLGCSHNHLASLEPLQACLGLRVLHCGWNQLISLEPLHGLKSLKDLDCKGNPSLSVQKIERFEKAMPSCRIFHREQVAKQREEIKRREQREATKTAELGIDKIVPANNHFGFRLFDQLLQQDQGKNVFVSPASVAIALAMTYNGAAGTTQTVMAKTLGLENLSLEEVNQANLALRNVLLHQPGVSLLIANSLWLNQDFHLEQAFLTQTQEYYAANVTNADFQSPATVSNINQWVKENTQGKIGPVVQRFNPLTVLLVINAIYFKGMWMEPFKRYNTKERDFALLTGENKRTPMMSQTDGYSYYEDHNYQAIRLPYRGWNLSMTIFLPSRGTPLESFPLLDKWQEWRTCGDYRKGTLVLPRFKVEYKVTLNDALKALGMTEAFSLEDADFSQMAKVPKGWNIYLSEIKHKTFVEVNEEGTEAAAVTYEDLDGCLANPIPPFEMIVDHPFLFTIQDDGTGTVLFIGAIVEPKQA
jgi:serpin B